MTMPVLDAATVWQLTLALWHTCWFGILAAGLAALGNLLLRRAPAWQRYWLSFAALAVMGACLPVSFLLVRASDADGAASPIAASVLSETTPEVAMRSEHPGSDAVARENNPNASTGLRAPPDGAVTAERPAHLEQSPARPPAARWEAPAHAVAPYVTALYLLGVIAMLGKLIVAIQGGKRLRAGSAPILEPRLLELVARQSRRLALKVVPAVAFCERIAVPVVVGVVRPMVLIPAGMLTGMPPDELSAVLTHELAHIRRHDHWLILVQRCLEALLFFHPAAWYLSRRVHAERESCCDDLVVAAGGDRLVYAQSLLRVAELRLSGDARRNKLVALAADGSQPSQLRLRIARLLGEACEPHVRFRNRWPAILLGLVCAAAFWSVITGTWQALAQTRDDKSQTVVVLEWLAFVEDGVMEEIRDLDDAKQKEDADTGIETIRCPAERLRSLLKERLEEAGQVAPQHLEIIPPSPEAFRRSGLAHGVTASAILTDPVTRERSIPAGFGGGGFIFVDKHEAAAKLKLSSLHFSGADGPVDFDEKIEEGRAILFAVPTTAPYSGIIVYEPLRIRTDQLEMYRFLHGADDWVKLGPAGTRLRVARAAAWRAKAPVQPNHDDPAWTRAFRGGGRIQLLGVGRPQLAPMIWWDPAGRPITGPEPSVSAHLRHHDQVALIRIWEAGTKRSRNHGLFSRDLVDVPLSEPSADGSQLIIVPATLSNADGKPAVEIGAGFGRWLGQANLDPEARAVASIDDTSVEITGSGGPTGAAPVCIHFSGKHERDVDLTVVAVSRDGKEIEPDANPSVYVDGESQLFSQWYSLRQADIDHFVLKTRPCHWAEFTGFAIEPAEPLQPPLDFSKPEDDQAANSEPRANALAENRGSGAREVPAAAQKDDADPLLPDVLAQTAQRGALNFDAIKTAHIRFRTSRSAGPYKQGLTPERCRELQGRYDLEEHPDQLGELISELLEGDRPRPRPWTDGELHVAGRKVRESMQYLDRAPDVQITDGEIALRWDEANSQLNIDPAGASHRYQMGLRDFWRPFRAPGVDNIERTVRAGGVLTLFFGGLAGWRHEIAVDEATGFLLRRNSHNAKAGTLEHENWLGWRAGADDIAHPTVIVRLDYRGNQLSQTSFLVVEKMQLNVPIPDSVFRMGAPAGSVIIDSRPDAVIGGGGINHDVFDVTSREQLIEAAKPLDPEPRTPQEKFAVAELARIYSLDDGEVLKRIAPPYPASRKHLSKLLGERYMPARRPIRSNVIPWEAGKLGSSWTFNGGTYRLEMLIGYLLKRKRTEIEGDRELLTREIPGDFVYRAAATPERLAEGLAEVASLEFQRPIRLVTREVERPVYVARGTLKLALPDGKTIALNGGPHSGDHGEQIGFGKLEQLLDEIGAYIHTPVVNEAELSSAALSWSSRWYDLADTPAEKRFQLDPQAVLKQITEQTGITFTPENRTTRILFVEVEADEARSSAP